LRFAAALPLGIDALPAKIQRCIADFALPLPDETPAVAVGKRGVLR
jgi:hypothetical protein